MLCLPSLKEWFKNGIILTTQISISPMRAFGRLQDEDEELTEEEAAEGKPFRKDDMVRYSYMPDDIV